MSNHTHEPWATSNGRIFPVGKEQYNIASISRDFQCWTLFNEDDARRIVACVNACEGIDTKALEMVDGAARLAVDDLAGEVSIVHAAKKQRDDLLAALELMVLIHDEPSGFEGKFGKALDDAISQQKEKIDMRLANARAAIAKAKGV